MPTSNTSSAWRGSHICRRAGRRARSGRSPRGSACRSLDARRSRAAARAAAAPARARAVRLGAFRDRGALRLLVLAVRLAELDVRSEAAGAERDIEPGLGVRAEQLAFGTDARLVAGIGELAGEAAVRIVRAADKGAELADLEAQAAGAAGGAGARIGRLGSSRGRCADRGTRSAHRAPRRCADPRCRSPRR